MLLGGLRYLLPLIESAHKLGYYVITADYLPNNIAHKYSDEYANVSIIDKEKVLQVAKEKHIDGIMSFAVDPGVVSAAYVQQEMSLPMFGPLHSVEILQNKGKFRQFLTDNHFNVPKAKSYSSLSDALQDSPRFSYPLIVKPTDSAGSKGVTRVDTLQELPQAIAHALDNSLSNTFIIEDFIEKKGFSSDSDCFSLNGELVFTSFSSQRFDENAAGVYTPAAFSWPSSMNMQEQHYLQSELQRLLTLLNMQTSVYNVETRIGTDNKPYIMEVSPRGGGNRLSEMIRFATGVDLIRAALQACVGETPTLQPQPYNGHWAELILHADQEGLFSGLEIDPALQPNVVQTDLWVQPGDHVRPFNGANDAIGTLVLNFPTEQDLNHHLQNVRSWLKVKVR